MRTRFPWQEVKAAYERVVTSTQKAYASPVHAERDRRFILERFSEGEAVGRLIVERAGADRQLRVLDVGTGNAGVALAVSNIANLDVVAMDQVFNFQVRPLTRASGLRLDYIVASGAAIPLADESFDVVLCLETLEHVREPRLFGAEIMRVLKPGGFCVIVTPARLRFLFRRDPHFGIPGLLLLPDSAQRWFATRVARVVPPEEYDVVHTYWYAGSIARLFPSRDGFQAIGAPPKGRLARRCWSFLQRITWKRCVIQKAACLPRSPGR